MKRVAAGLLTLLVLAGLACKNNDPPAIKETPPPVAASAKQVATGSKRYVVDPVGKAAVTIDAPLEKFKGTTTQLSGVFDVNAGDLSASTGEVVADLDGFSTSTFQKAGDDEAQTEHAKNWFEIGKEVEPKLRDDYKMARFTVEKIDPSSAKSVADVPEKDGVRTVTLKASGSLRIHGRSSKKTVSMEVSFKGPPEAPTEIRFKTTAVLTASLSEHDVKPRDITGKFLAGALEQVGKKIDDKAQITVEGTAKPKP
jgi:hypothetical protein